MNLEHLKNKYNNNREDLVRKNTFYHGIVIENDDPEILDRIKVRIISKDSGINDNAIMWCYNMMPSGFYMIPLVGEHVIVFFRNPAAEQAGRFYIGPIHSAKNGKFEISEESTTKMEIDSNGF